MQQSELHKALGVHPQSAQAPVSKLIEELRREAKQNPVFNAVCYVFAIRERARQQVTIAALRLRMTNEGYRFSKTDYKKVLQFMGDLGIGTLQREKNEVVALKNIRTTLQSIGLAAVGNSDKLETFSPQYSYDKLPAKATEQAARVLPATNADIKVPPKTITQTQLAVSLTVHFGDNPVTFNLPKGLTTQELGELLADLWSFRGDQ